MKTSQKSFSARGISAETPSRMKCVIPAENKNKALPHGNKSKGSKSNGSKIKWNDMKLQPRAKVTWITVCKIPGLTRAKLKSI